MLCNLGFVNFKNHKIMQIFQTNEEEELAKRINCIQVMEVDKAFKKVLNPSKDIQMKEMESSFGSQ